MTEFPPAADQPDHKLEPHECLSNSLHMAQWGQPPLRYAEGIAKNSLGIWYCHAWNVNEAGEAVDFTWEPAAQRYLGRIIGTAEKSAATAKAGVYHFDHANMPYVPDGEMGLDCLTREQADWYASARKKVRT